MTVQRVLAGEDLRQYHNMVLSAADSLEFMGRPDAANRLRRAHRNAVQAEITMEVPPTVAVSEWLHPSEIRVAWLQGIGELVVKYLMRLWGWPA